MEPLTWAWWLQVVEIPALIMLFLMVQRNRENAEAEAEKNRTALEAAIEKRQAAAAAAAKAATDDLFNFKIECAKQYATLYTIASIENRLITNMNAIEGRLNARLEHMEKKIDRAPKD